ncbi:hypothetical protein [Bradyrhizobium sp. Ash2021]|uniref:hypothetical protein n=1 Tax=Bradyrhizobium sp. Ash2021 TaxID=2954771 RepID=UPI0028161517|nr:hypothetical protein [Bradyrhizobium sp. Ash2021]WMT70969.1 hypothetical protein NL528_22920 [Bradyrhizobium sp. Ash2021]
MIETASINEAHQLKAAVDSKRILVTVPADVRLWLEERAKYHGGTLSAEIVRCVRERMERELAKVALERAKERAVAAAAAAAAE